MESAFLFKGVYLIYRMCCVFIAARAFVVVASGATQRAGVAVASHAERGSGAHGAQPLQLRALERRLDGYGARA